MSRQDIAVNESMCVQLAGDGDVPTVTETDAVVQRAVLRVLNTSAPWKGSRVTNEDATHFARVVERALLEDEVVDSDVSVFVSSVIPDGVELTVNLGDVSLQVTVTE